MLPGDEVHTDRVPENEQHRPGKDIYTRKQLDQFVAFQDSYGTHRAYLAEMAELAYNGRNEKGEWGLAQGSQEQASMIDILRMSFIPLYKETGHY
jgi:hypothetical protein